MKTTEGAWVRLTTDVPNELHPDATIPAGSVGMVVEVLTVPSEGYNVEFRRGDDDFDVVAVGPDVIEPSAPPEDG